MDKNFKIHYFKLTPKTIEKFYFPEDGRAFAPISKNEYWITVEHLKEEIEEYCKKNPKKPRYDLIVFNYKHDKPHFRITDGCHRTYALRQLFKEKAIKEFNVILLPGTTGINAVDAVQKTKDLIKMLRKKGLPKEIIKQRHVIIDGKQKIIIRPY